MPFFTKGKETIILTEKQESILFKGKYLDFLEDPSGKLNISDVSSSYYQQKFNLGKEEDFIQGNENLSSSYWLRINIRNTSRENLNYVTELYDFRIAYYEFYLVKNGIVVFSGKGGADYNFYSKEIIHKNYVDLLPLNSIGDYTIFYKIKSSHPVSFIGQIRTFEKLVNYSNSEYFLLALFYGAVLSLAIYNFFIFIAVGDRAYLYFVLYILSIAFYSLSLDGLGFQYLWSNFPIVNNYIFNLSDFFVMFWMLLYSRRFLDTKNSLKIIDKVILLILFKNSTNWNSFG